MKHFAILVAVSATAAGTWWVGQLQHDPSIEMNPELVAIANSLRNREQTEIVLPERNTDLRIRKVAKPAQSNPWAEVPAVTATYTLSHKKWGSPSKAGKRQRIMRQEDLVYLQNQPGNEEWLFRQNPLQFERAHGTFVDYYHQMLLDYPQADLESEGIASCWDSVANLGADPKELQDATRTGEFEKAFGLQFERLTIEREEYRLEIFWNDSARLPLRVVRSDEESQWSKELTDVTWQVEADRLQPPRSGIPGSRGSISATFAKNTCAAPTRARACRPASPTAEEISWPPLPTP